MEFINLTPFAASAYVAIDKQDREYEVIVMRTVYQLKPLDAELHIPSQTANWFEAKIIDDAPPPLITEDQFEAEVGKSHLLAESDLAPYKPKCDVLVTGHAWAPSGKHATNWPIRLRVSAPIEQAPQPQNDLIAPQPLNPLMQLTLQQEAAWYEASQTKHQEEVRSRNQPEELKLRTLLEKTLLIHGERYFDRGLIGGWSLKSASPCTRVQLSYKFAYGGASVVTAQSNINTKNQKTEFRLNEVCYANPIGCGWVHADWEKALKQAKQEIPNRIPAPQVEYPNERITELDIAHQPANLSVEQIVQVAQSYRYRPAGLGPIGRPWTPRVGFTGTYDQRWLDERWPNLPKDMDFAYWNCAPQDQQIAFPPSNAVIELYNLTDPQLTPSGYSVVELPGHRASVLFHLKNGLMIGAQPVIDTLHIDTDKLQIALVWRVAVLREMEIEKAEARFEVNSAKPLFPYVPQPLQDADFDPLATQPIPVIEDENQLLEPAHGR
jgi:hypothetical protein